MRLVMGFAILMGTTLVHAEDKSSGCGLGWKITSRNSIVSSYTRAMTNALTSSTLGMTSGTSGCDSHSIVMKEKAEIHYAEANFHSLMTEMAMGEGEYLTAFASVLGCSQAQVPHFIRSSQKNYPVHFPADGTDPARLLQSVKGSMQAESLCGRTRS